MDLVVLLSVSIGDCQLELLGPQVHLDPGGARTQQTNSVPQDPATDQREHHEQADHQGHHDGSLCCPFDRSHQFVGKLVYRQIVE